MKYNPHKIEKKWQKYWEKNGTNRVDLDAAKKPFYNLMMFPYPSAEGLHVGNMYAFVHSDAYGRFTRLKGFDVFEPIGLDGFGIHSENYAIKIGEHIKKVSQRTEKHFYEQLHSIGNQYDWSRKLETYKPEYYQWTQWLFLQMFKAGLAYRAEASVNWCPSCKTVLSDEQVIGGQCERCGATTEKKQMEQWFFKITDFAEKLLKNLDIIDWPEEIKTIQRNWIGKSEGAEFKMKIITPTSSPPFEGGEEVGVIEVFTTRLDTVFGMTFALIAPEHKIISKIKNQISNIEEVEKYIEAAKNKSELQRVSEIREKTGVEIKGVKVLNPFTKKEIPLFVSDFVLGHYGTGAIMAVPAHDERDFEFAKSKSLQIKGVIIPGNKEIVGVGAFLETKDGKFLFQKRDSKPQFNPNKITPFGGSLNQGEEFETEKALRRELFEELKLKYEDLDLFPVGIFESHNLPGKYIQIFHIKNVDEKEMFLEEGEEIVKLSLTELLKEDDATEFTKEIGRHIQAFNYYAFDDKGTLINSGEYNGLASDEAIKKIGEWLEKNKIGRRAVNYKLRDWCVSRQRYWGPPIPMIYCSNSKCHSRESGNPGPGSRVKPGMTEYKTTFIDGVEYAAVPVPEKDLPVLLPEMNDFLPDGSGKGPLNKDKKFVETICPQCGGPAKRETDVSDPFVDSCWYYLRYVSTEFADRPFDKGRLDKWIPVNMYIGGKEHAVLHLLYSRFVAMVLNNLGYLKEEEPFKKFFAHGLLIRDGAKMSKSKGNIINPDEYIKKFGADSVRLYLMFLGDARLGGNWQDAGMNGMFRFVNRIWKLSQNVIASPARGGAKQSRDITAVHGIASSQTPRNDKEINTLLHKTIKKVGEDLENLKFNTAIAALMILANAFEKEKEVSTIHYSLFAILLSPFAPHLAEELWARLGHKKSIFTEKWPEYDRNLIKEETIELVVQINGKVRGKFSVPAEISEEEAKKLALADASIQKWLAGQEPKKVIFVRGRLVNIVV